MENDGKTRGPAITLNGKQYNDAGQVIDPTSHAPMAKTRRYGSFDITPAARVHAGPARSQTLRRDGLRQPAVTPPLASRHTRTISPVATHPAVSRFTRPVEAAAGTAHVVTPAAVLSSLNPSKPVGLTAQVQNYTPRAAVAAPLTRAKVSKKTAVTDHQLAHAPTKAHKKTRAKAAAPSVNARWQRFARKVRLSPGLIVTGIIILVLIISVICYLTIPALSLFVAAKSAGVDATYPGFVPDGYHFSGPVTYGDGDVTLKFKASGSSDGFTIDQRASYWDSGAVLDNYVLARSPNYLTYSESGITIYTFGSQAAWVNAGVLHTINGSAPLTSDQILHIAGSM